MQYKIGTGKCRHLKTGLTAKNFPDREALANPAKISNTTPPPPPKVDLHNIFDTKKIVSANQTNGDDIEPFLLSVAVDVFECVTFLIDL